jgi:hypothetical protein
MLLQQNGKLVNTPHEITPLASHLLTLQLLEMEHEELLHKLCDRYNACECEFKKRFELKGLSFYINSFDKCGSSETHSDSLEAEKRLKNLCQWVQKCGG